MKLLKLLSFILIIYFVRRFMQMFLAMKKIQEEQAKGQTYQTYQQKNSRNASQKNTIKAEFKVLD